MSSWSDRDDLHVRIEQGLVSRYGPNVVETFPDSPLPGWLQMPLMLLDLTTTGEQMAAIVLDVQVWSSICGKVHYPHGPGYHGEELPGQRDVCRYFWHSSGVNERVTCDSKALRCCHC